METECAVTEWVEQRTQPPDGLQAPGSDTLLDDFILSLRIVMQGHTIAYCANAYAVESGSADMREEEKRKVRIAA